VAEEERAGRGGGGVRAGKEGEGGGGRWRCVDCLLRMVILPNVDGDVVFCEDFPVVREKVPDAGNCAFIGSEPGRAIL